MKTQLLLIAMISLSVNALTATTQCDCTELVQSADCKGGCTWSTTDSSCSAKTLDCTTYTQDTCDSYTGCAWNETTSKCAAFTACADYTVTAARSCYAKDSTCVPGTAGTDGKFPCQTGSITCSTFTSTSDCNGMVPADNAICWFKSSTCSQVDVSKCSVITDQDICAQVGCNWTTAGACAAYTCADMTTADSCIVVMTDDQSGVNICTWDSTGSKCSDAADVSTLTSSNCYDKTVGFYYWDGSACSECSGSSSNGYILAFIGLIVMVMF